jgi:hypothetical protein
MTAKAARKAPRPPGRPAKYGVAMTPAERARAYRERRHDRQRVALRTPKDATLPALLGELREAVLGGHVVEVEAITAELNRRTREA